MSKKYGLIIPGMQLNVETPKADFTKPSIFGSDSDSDDGPPIRSNKIKLAPIVPGNAEKRQAKRLQERALEEDPTVFQYDELYDEIEQKRDESKNAKSEEVKKPRYINRLLECAERRKIENERRIERMVQKEREEEGEQYKDKDSFVTSAYRKKLEELREAEEREKREDYLEAIGDVTKQQDLGGFYRHLYEIKLGAKNQIKENANTSLDKDQSDIEKMQTQKIKPSKPRTYRKRRPSEEDDADESKQTNQTTPKKAHLQSNLDADSDFSIDSSSASDNEDVKGCETAPDNKDEIAIKLEPIADADDHNETNNHLVLTSPIKVENIKEKKIETKMENNQNKKNIWMKRTVGEVFEGALQRYYERKAGKRG